MIYNDQNITHISSPKFLLHPQRKHLSQRLWVTHPPPLATGTYHPSVSMSSTRTALNFISFCFLHLYKGNRFHIFYICSYKNTMIYSISFSFFLSINFCNDVTSVTSNYKLNPWLKNSTGCKQKDYYSSGLQIRVNNNPASKWQFYSYFIHIHFIFFTTLYVSKLFKKHDIWFLVSNIPQYCRRRDFILFMAEYAFIVFYNTFFFYPVIN